MSSAGGRTGINLKGNPGVRSVLRGVLNFGVIWLIEMKGAESEEDM
jgi:hypothetical protein